MTNDWVKKLLALGIGAAAMSKDRIEKIVGEWVERGEVSRTESKEIIQRLVRRGEEEQAELKRFIRGQLQDLLKELRIAAADDIKRLEARIAALEAKAGISAPEGEAQTAE